MTTVPTLAVFGAHLDAVTGTVVSWRAAYNDCQASTVARAGAPGDRASSRSSAPPEAL